MRRMTIDIRRMLDLGIMVLVLGIMMTIVDLERLSTIADLGKPSLVMTELEIHLLGQAIKLGKVDITKPIE
jgi:hypothetical protein